MSLPGEFPVVLKCQPRVAEPSLGVAASPPLDYTRWRFEKRWERNWQGLH